MLESNIALYLKDKGVNLSAMARATGINYNILYASIYDNSRTRELRGAELLKICKFLDKDPMDFADAKGR